MSYDPVIEPSTLSSLPVVHLLDVRDYGAFSSGHVRGAVRVLIEVWEAAAKAGETSFENTAYWERAIVELGADANVPLVVYDDGRMTAAARFWFILQYFGVEVYILNGGRPAIEGRDDLSGTTHAARSCIAFRARPGTGLVGLVGRQALKAELDKDVKIFDARTGYEFKGEDLRRNARGGHLPGAKLLPHASLLDGSA